MYLSVSLSYNATYVTADGQSQPRSETSREEKQKGETLKDTESYDSLKRISRAAAGLTFATLPAEVVMRARQRVLDTVGCLVAGYDAGISDLLRAYVAAQGGAPQATLLPGGEKTSVGLIALAHAAYIHGLELSDAAPRGTAHPGNEVIPPALAIAEREGRTGAEILAAVVAGYETEIRFGRVLFPSAFYRGWWTPGMLGAIGAAATTAHLLKLDARGFENTLGIVLNLAPTTMIKANEEGHTVKWLLGGQACAAGVLAAEMAALGTEGMRDIVDGWFRVIGDEIHPERLVDGVAADGTFTSWELLSGVVTKHYATVGPLTSALDATFDLILEHDIRIDDVTDIEVECMRRTAVFNAVHPENEVTARASLPYCLAVALLTRDRSDLLGPAFRKEMLRDPVVHAAADLVRIVENPEYEQQYPAKSLARVTLSLKDGRVVSQEVDRSARGRYLHPTDADIENKFRSIATPILAQERTDRVVDLCGRLETLPGVAPLIDALTLRR
jgi:2-methylcitrate dehydratase PrpD